MEVLRYKPLDKGLLRGTFDLKIPKWGNLIIYEMTHFIKNGHEWVAFPAKQYDKDGEKKYFSYCRFELPETGKKFSDQCLQAIKTYFENSHENDRQNATY